MRTESFTVLFTFLALVVPMSTSAVNCPSGSNSTECSAPCGGTCVDFNCSVVREYPTADWLANMGRSLPTTLQITTNCSSIGVGGNFEIPIPQLPFNQITSQYEFRTVEVPHAEMAVTFPRCTQSPPYANAPCLPPTTTLPSGSDCSGHYECQLACAAAGNETYVVDVNEVAPGVCALRGVPGAACVGSCGPTTTTTSTTTTTNTDTTTTTSSTTTSSTTTSSTTTSSTTTSSTTTTTLPRGHWVCHDHGAQNEASCGGRQYLCTEYATQISNFLTGLSTETCAIGDDSPTLGGGCTECGGSPGIVVAGYVCSCVP